MKMTSNSHHSPVTILAIDAEIAALEHLTLVLEGAGHRCVAAGSVESAIQAAHDSPPELIICDVNVGGTSGLVVCEQLRRQTGLEEVPLLFLSAKQTPDIIRRAHAAGGTYYVRKPFDPKVLLQLVESVVSVLHLSGA